MNSTRSRDLGEEQRKNSLDTTSSENSPSSSPPQDYPVASAALDSVDGTTGHRDVVEVEPIARVLSQLGIGVVEPRPGIIHKNFLDKNGKIPTGGKQEKGDKKLQGRYKVLSNNSKEEIYAKQNPDKAKIIAEFLAAKIMRGVTQKLYPDKNDLFADIRFTIFKDDKGHYQIFLCSSSIPNYKPLFVDVNYVLDKEIPNEKPNGLKVTASNVISDLNNALNINLVRTVNNEVEKVVGQSRYNRDHLISAILGSILVKDLDTNLGNIGTSDASPLPSLTHALQNVTEKSFEIDAETGKPNLVKLFDEAIEYVDSLAKLFEDASKGKNTQPLPYVIRAGQQNDHAEHASLLVRELKELKRLKEQCGEKFDPTKSYSRFHSKLKRFGFIKFDRERKGLDIARLDFDAALVDLKDQMQLQLSFTQNSVRLMSGVPVDFNQSFKSIIQSEDFAAGLGDFGKLTAADFNKIINESFETIVQLFDADAIANFAVTMGMRPEGLKEAKDCYAQLYPTSLAPQAEDKDLPLIDQTTINERMSHPLVLAVRNFMVTKMDKRARSGRDLSLKVRISALFLEHKGQPLELKLRALLSDKEKFAEFVRLLPAEGDFPFEFAVPNPSQCTQLLREIKKRIQQDNLDDELRHIFNDTLRGMIRNDAIAKETIKGAVRNHVAERHFDMAVRDNAFDTKNIGTPEQQAKFKLLLAEVYIEKEIFRIYESNGNIKTKLKIFIMNAMPFDKEIAKHCRQFIFSGVFPTGEQNENVDLNRLLIEIKEEASSNLTKKKAATSRESLGGSHETTPVHDSQSAKKDIVDPASLKAESNKALLAANLRLSTNNSASLRRESVIEGIERIQPPRRGDAVMATNEPLSATMSDADIFQPLERQKNEEPSLNLELKRTFHRIFNNDDVARWSDMGIPYIAKTMFDYPSFPTLGSKIWFGITVLPTFAKNLLKLATEFLPGVIETAAEYGAQRCLDYVIKHNKSNNVNEQFNTDLALLGYVGLKAISWLAYISRTVLMRITSPITSAKQAYYLAVPKDGKPVSTTRKIAGYGLALLSLTASFASYVGLAFVLAPIAPVFIASKLAAASTWLVNSTGPVVGPAIAWLGTHLSAGFAAIGIHIGASALVTQAVAATVAVVSPIIGGITMLFNSVVKHVLTPKTKMAIRPDDRLFATKPQEQPKDEPKLVKSNLPVADNAPLLLPVADNAPILLPVADKAPVEGRGRSHSLSYYKGTLFNRVQSASALNLKNEEGDRKDLLKSDSEPTMPTSQPAKPK